jgi:multiple sugar transport system permease protein
MISPTTFYILVMGMIGNLQAFANFQVMNPIGKDGVIHTMVYRVWWAAFEADLQQYGIGYASALGWVSGIIIIVFTIILFKTQKYWVYYDN